MPCWAGRDFKSTASGLQILDLIERFKQVMGQPVVAHRPIVALDVGALLRLSRLDEADAYATFGGLGSVTALMYSGPLSQRVAWGLPRHSIILSRESE